MRARSFLALTAAVFLCSALPAGAQGEQEKQLQLPDGDGKAIVQNRCSACHGLNMLPNQFGSTAEQWQKVFSSMVALPGDQPTVVSQVPREELPRQGQTGRGRRSRERDRVDQGMDGADARLSGRTIRSRRRTARSGGRGKFANVARPARSEDRRDEGVPAEDAAVRAPRPGGRQGRQHLVHGEPKQL